MQKIFTTSECYKIPDVASRSLVGTNPKQLQMSIPIESERRQFLWYFLYFCWDRLDDASLPCIRTLQGLAQALTRHQYAEDRLGREDFKTVRA